MRIQLKTTTPAGGIANENVGLVGLRFLLQKESPLIGLSVEVDDDSGAVNAKHFLYKLSLDANAVERYPLCRRADTISVMEHYTRAETPTDLFMLPGENITSLEPTLPDNPTQYLFSETEKNVVLSSINNGLSNAADFFPDKDRLVIRSILVTLFSAGFMSHARWQDNLALLLENQDKCEEIKRGLVALHEGGILMQKTFTDVVTHATPWKCASALRYLTHKYVLRKKSEEITTRAVPFSKVRHVDDSLFRALPEHFQTQFNAFVDYIIQHPFPNEIARIIALLYHHFGPKLDLDLVTAISDIPNEKPLNRLGATLFYISQQELLSKENYLILLKQFKIPLRSEQIFYVVNWISKKYNLVLTQSLFNAIVFSEDPQLLVVILSRHQKLIEKYRKYFPEILTPTKKVAYEKIMGYCNNPTTNFVPLFEHLAKTGLATHKNLASYHAHKNSEALGRVLNEAFTAGIVITQPLFDTLATEPTPANKSTVEILARTPVGRDVLRKHLTIQPETGLFLLGKTEIPTETLSISIENKSIREWLSLSTEEEFTQKAQAIIDATEAEMEAHVATNIPEKKQALFDQFIKSQFKLFPLRHAQGMVLDGERTQSDAVTPVIQQVVFGNERGKTDSVKTALEAVKDDPKKLLTLLRDISTVTDYSGKKVTDTLLKAALHAGDVEMCQMLIPYFDLIPDGKKQLTIQMLEVFPDGVDATYKELEENSKQAFEPMLQAAINAIFVDPDPSNPNDHINNLTATLNKQVNNPLYQKLETLFRKPFEALSHREKTFNPYHLLRVYEACNTLWDQCEHDGSDPHYKKRDLFFRQIIGYVQRFVPACYAQAFVQGLWDLVKVERCQGSDWRAKPLERELKLKYHLTSYFSSLSSSLEAPSGLGFDFAILSFGGQVAGRQLYNLRQQPGPPVFSKIFVEQKHADFRTLCCEGEHNPTPMI